MFYDQSPPKESSEKEFPSFNTVVSVSNCWYYLSLLERFVDITKDMSKEVLKLYLVRAEYRYFLWIYKMANARLFLTATPPIDIAFFWQAHMLSPLRYREDGMRSTSIFQFDRIPLSRIHETQNVEPDSYIIKDWHNIMGDEPYDLAKDILNNESEESLAKVTCIVCLNRIWSPWKECAEWRTDHSVALQCHCCSAMFTVKHVGKANLFADNSSTHRTAGLIMDSRGGYLASKRVHELLMPLKEFKALPFNRGVKPIEDLIREKGEKERYFKLERVTNTKKLIDAIQSTYLCTPYKASSIDLIQAVARQYKFAFKVTKTINWNGVNGIINGIRQYSNFLAVIKDNPGLTAVPTIEIDLAWHTHMLHHHEYFHFCNYYMGRLINHDDNIPEKSLSYHADKTKSAWKVRNEKRDEAEVEAIANFSPPKAKATGDLQASNNKNNSLKSKIKSIFTKKDKSKSSMKTITPVLPPPVPKPATNGYVDIKGMFKSEYQRGSYYQDTVLKCGANNQVDCLSNEIKGNHSEDISNKEDSKDVEITSEVVEDSTLNQNDVDEKNEEGIGYEKANISFHDKRDIKEFIELKNDDELMDKTFISVKSSHYGFIGTSTCANTDYLDQWQTKDTQKNTKDYSEEYLRVSRYSKVFLTKGNDPVFSANRLYKIPLLDQKVNKKKYGPHYTSQNSRYNTAGDDFNWYQVSLTWNNCNEYYHSHKTDGGGGWSNCSGSNNPTSGCAGLSSTGSADKISSCSSSGGGSSSCGGSSSSCGGGSSSCGSSCGGGGSSCSS